VVDAVPAGHVQLGHVGAQCASHPRSRPLTETLVSDLVCGETLLRAALLARAAASGATALLKPDCLLTRDREGVRCSAEALAPSDPSAAAEPLENAPLAPPSGLGDAFDERNGDLPFQTALEAWKVAVSYNPSVRLRTASRVDSGQVSVLAALGPAQVAVGSVVARCKGECAERSLRSGLLLGTAWLGAETLADIQCVAQGEEHLCQGIVGVSAETAASRTLASAQGQ
jgi:hypothetical protein